MNRRTMLAMTAVALSGCAVPSTVSGAASDAQIIAAAMQSLEPQMMAFIADPAIRADIVKYVSDISAAAASLQATTSAASGSLASQIISAVQSLAGSVLGYTGLSLPITAAINAALALLPVIAAAAGLSSASLTPPTMTPDQARMTLRAVTK